MAWRCAAELRADLAERRRRELLAKTWLKLAPKRLAAQHRHTLLCAPD